ncbi:MAG: hypothetical protein ACK2TU_12765 [Anaerolineales bacterium]
MKSRCSQGNKIWKLWTLRAYLLHILAMDTMDKPTSSTALNYPLFLSHAEKRYKTPGFEQSCCDKNLDIILESME